MKPQKDKSDENIDEPQTSEDYYYSAEYPEPEADDVDVEMLERFIELLGQQQGSVSADDVGSDDLIPARDDNAQAPNTSSGTYSFKSLHFLRKIFIFGALNSVPYCRIRQRADAKRSEAFRSISGGRNGEAQRVSVGWLQEDVKGATG